MHLYHRDIVGDGSLSALTLFVWGVSGALLVVVDSEAPLTPHTNKV